MEDGKGLEKVRDNAVLHQELLSLLQHEMVLDVLLILGQDIEKRENKQYNLLLMEILHHMLKNQVSRVCKMDHNMWNSFTHLN